MKKIFGHNVQDDILIETVIQSSKYLLVVVFKLRFMSTSPLSPRVLEVVQALACRSEN